MAGPDLTDFLARAGRKSFAWGSFDCLLYAADWVAERAGIDPAADLRGTYGNEREARRLMLGAGGIVGLMGNRLRSIEWVETRNPQRGDVGLVRIPFKIWKDRVIVGPVGSICVSPRMWAMKPADKVGIIAHDFPVIRAWTAAPR